MAHSWQRFRLTWFFFKLTWIKLTWILSILYFKKAFLLKSLFDFELNRSVIHTMYTACLQSPLPSGERLFYQRDSVPAMWCCHIGGFKPKSQLAHFGSCHSAVCLFACSTFEGQAKLSSRVFLPKLNAIPSISFGMPPHIAWSAYQMWKTKLTTELRPSWTSSCWISF